jgi:hypothetical protein
MLNIWRVQDKEQLSIIESTIRQKDLQKFLVMIVIDLSEPWNLMESLTEWMSAVKDLILEGLCKKLEVGQFDRMQTSMTDNWKLYENPETD